jgi:structural maintenance of chromosome 2
MECQRQITKLEGEIKQYGIKSKALRDAATSKRAAAKKEEKEFGEMKKTHERASRTLQEVEGKLTESRYSHDAKSLQERRVNELQDQLRDLKDREANLAATLQQLMFDEWTSPRPGFDRSKVKGRIGTLINVDDVKTYGPALEIAAGGRLYNVVIDNEVTGKDILQRGKLRQRVTFLPLDKINSSIISSEKKAKAVQLVGKVSFHLKYYH